MWISYVLLQTVYSQLTVLQSLYVVLLKLYISINHGKHIANSNQLVAVKLNGRYFPFHKQLA
jgi:hypothetical protein